MRKPSRSVSNVLRIFSFVLVTAHLDRHQSVREGRLNPEHQTTAEPKCMATVKKTLAQIYRARQTLRDLGNLVAIDAQSSDRRTLLGLYHRTLFFFVLQRIREAENTLDAAEGEARPTGSCLVDAGPFEIIESFRAVGPRRLNGLLTMRQEDWPDIHRVRF